MTDSSATQPPGWYYAQGDPPGTQRYWDGSQWVGGPQAAQGAGAEPVGYGSGAVAVAGAGVPAEYGSRFVAYLIDIGILVVGYIAVFILTAIGSAVSDPLGAILSIVGLFGLLGVWIWNFVIKQGSTGQTVGKQQQNIKLVADATGAPVGGGMSFLRYLLAGAMSTFTCGLVGLLDILWPLWDNDKKRLTDKILNFSVINA